MEENFVSQGLLSFIDYNYKTALDYFNKAIGYKSDYNYFLYRGITYLKLGYYELSISDFNKCEELNSNDSRLDKQKIKVFFNRALAYLYNSNLINAKTDFTTAKILAENNNKILIEEYINKIKNLNI